MEVKKNAFLHSTIDETTKSEWENLELDERLGEVIDYVAFIHGLGHTIKRKLHLSKQWLKRRAAASKNEQRKINNENTNPMPTLRTSIENLCLKQDEPGPSNATPGPSIKRSKRTTIIANGPATKRKKLFKKKIENSNRKLMFQILK